MARAPQPSHAKANTPNSRCRLFFLCACVCLSAVEDEVLLRENKSRFVLFPIKYDRIWDMYKKHKAAFWEASEVDLAHDGKDWEKLTNDERHCQLYMHTT